MKHFALTVCLIILASIFLVNFAAAGTLNIGALNDTTGPTSDVGKDYAMGISEAIHYINDHGGVNGKKIKLYQFDYGLRVPEALTKYKLFKQLKCIAVLGWGTADTEALLPNISKDKIPYVTASYSAHLTNPVKAPYNFFAATDYSSNARAALTAWYDNKWKLKEDHDKRKPRFVCAYQFSSSLGKTPIAAIKDQAKILGFDIGPDQDISFVAIDTKSQVLSIKKYKADVVWHGGTTMSVATTLRDAYALGLNADFIVNNWGIDEKLPELAGKAAEGVMGPTVCAYFGEDVKLMDKVVEYAKKCNPNVPLEKRSVHTIQAWANAIALWEALKVADNDGKIDGESIKSAFESFTKVDIGLGVSPLTYISKDHRISGKVPIYELKNGKYLKLTTIDLKKRWPDKWENEWHGW